eukprot:gene20897-22948_t
MGTSHRVFEMFVELSIRGYHAYKEEEVFVGEVMVCEPEEDNEHDKHMEKQRPNALEAGIMPEPEKAWSYLRTINLLEHMTILSGLKSR